MIEHGSRTDLRADRVEYRHVKERSIFFPITMGIAAFAVLIGFGCYYFLRNRRGV